MRERLPLWLQLRCAVEPRSLAALAVALGLAAHHFRTGRPQTVTVPPAQPAPRAAAAAPSASTPSPVAAAGGEPLVVDVAREVCRPGLHRLPPGARVDDTLRAAGGVRPGTDTTGLNRARPVVDGEQILVGATPGAAPGGAGCEQPARRSAQP